MEQIANLRFGLDAAEAVVRAALQREESRGGHFRTDFSDTEDAWRCNIFIRLDDASFDVQVEPVEPLRKNLQYAIEEEHSLDYHHLE